MSFFDKRTKRRSDPVLTRVDPAGLHRMEVGEMTIEIRNPQEAKHAIRELRALKRRLTDEKKAIGRELTENPSDEKKERRSAINQHIRQIDAGIAQLEEFILMAAIEQHQALAAQEQRAIAEAMGY